MNTNYRLPLGLIVEGECEYACFQSIFSKITQQKKHNIPMICAGGIGKILNKIEEQLWVIIKSGGLRKIIVCLDGRDAVKLNFGSNCIEVKNILQKKCNDFLREHEANSEFLLPETIVVVIADKTFESWICADLDGLKKNDLINKKKIKERFTNVDDEISNPAKWLTGKLKSNIDIKNARYRRELIKYFDPTKAKEHSKSFDKFYREISSTELTYK